MTLVAISSLDAHRKEAGKGEELYLLGPLLDATRVKMVTEAPTQSSADSEGFLMLLFVVCPTRSGPGAPFLFVAVVLMSVLRPPMSGIGVAKLSMDALRTAGQGQNGQANLTSILLLDLQAKPVRRLQQLTFFTEQLMILGLSGLSLLWCSWTGSKIHSIML